MRSRHTAVEEIRTRHQRSEELQTCVQLDIHVKVGGKGNISPARWLSGVWTRMVECRVCSTRRIVTTTALLKVLSDIYTAVDRQLCSDFCI